MFISAHTCSLIPVIAVIAFVSISYLYSFADASSVVSPVTPIYIRQASQSEQCGFQGNSDLYGVGIRVGYYTQALAAWLANFFVLSEAKSLRPTNILFMFAIFIALIWISHTPSQTYAIEAFLLLQLLLAIWFIAAKEKSRWSVKYWPLSPSQTIIREAVAVGILTYNLWFWWRGLDLFRQTPCGTYILFLVVKLKLDGWFRTAQKVLSIISLCFQASLTLGHIAQLIDHWKMRHLRTTTYFDQLARNLLQESLTTSVYQDSHALTVVRKQLMLQEDPIYRDQACSPIVGLSICDSQAAFINPPESFEESTFGSDTISKAIEPPSKLPTPPQEHQPTIETGPSVRPQLLVLTTLRQFPALPSLAGLRMASAYLSSILISTSADPPILILSIPHTPLTLTIPSPSSLFTFPTPIKLLATPLHVPVLIPLFTHIYSLRKYPINLYPSFLFRTLSSPHYSTLEYSTLSTYLVLLRIHILPAHNRKLYTLPTAIFTLLITIGLIFSIEFAVFWNNIQGIRSLGAVGQLVPLVLGLGGLTKVCWTLGVGRWRSMVTGKSEKSGITDDQGEGCEGQDGNKWMEAAKQCAEVYFSIEEQLGDCDAECTDMFSKADV